MALVPGTKLGPYENLSFLGAGGMGEVYRARGPRLGREVAIKLLHGKFFEGIIHSDLKPENIIITKDGRLNGNQSAEKKSHSGEYLVEVCRQQGVAVRTYVAYAQEFYR